MNRHLNSIAGRLSLRPPQRESLEILDRVTEIVTPRKSADIAAALAVIKAEYPTLSDFERDFPSLCFALATGVGKTRLMGAFIAYLHLAHGLNHFFVLAPNLTIYKKLIDDFTPNTPKYVFKGIAEFATESPEIITGDNYDQRVGGFETWMRVKINIFNISKINTEVRGGKSPRIKRLSEYIGQSYFDYLASLDDLVLLMDESHRYRATAGVKAINELKPILGLELTATPFTEGNGAPVAFKNVVFDYPLARAMADGFVKEPAVVTQKNFDPTQFSDSQLERIKLEDGLRLHEATKVELETYARQSGRHKVKPFVLVIARDTIHAKELLTLIESDAFFEGRYRGRAIQVDSSTTQRGEESEEIVEKLIKVEHPDEPTEIVIHVNMLKEGWDVNNLYTIIPLRAANARTLIEQSIGRGLRLPYGTRTGVTAVDRLNIVAHDKFQEIVDAANQSNSPIRLQQVRLDPIRDFAKTRSVTAEPNLTEDFKQPVSSGGDVTGSAPVPVFQTEEERKVGQITLEVFKRHETLPSSKYLQRDEIQAEIVKEVAAMYMPPVQPELEGIVQKPDIGAVVAKTAALFVEKTISIPRIVVLPMGEVMTGFNDFTLDVSSVRLQPVDRDLLIKHLRTAQQDVLKSDGSATKEKRPEDYLVRALMDCDDISYDDHAPLLYNLATQMMTHLRSYLSEDDAVNVARYHQQHLANLIHAQMEAHQWEKAGGYEAKIMKGFTTLRPNAYSAEGEAKAFRVPVADPANIRRYIFGGFQKCLYPVQKFDSDTERRFTVILEDDSQVMKWFKPVPGQFQIYYSADSAYEPDFVVETESCHYLCEPKRADQIQSEEVKAKKAAALEWCDHATKHSKEHGTKPWKYVLVPHEAVKDNMTLDGLVAQYVCD